MAECMALHRDGSAFGLTPLETHVRRLIWHQLCFLDIRTCEAQGPRPTIHREDYDALLPYNCDDKDLIVEANASPSLSKQAWASSSFAVLRFEMNEMLRVIWVDRVKLERRKTHLSIVVAKIERFCQRLDEKYDDFLDDSTPIKRYAKLVKELFTCRMHVMVLHPYHSNTSNPLSERLHSMLIKSGIRIVEIGMELETNPDFFQWKWYLGAFMQYQIALLLTTEAFHGNSKDELHRISRCLDYVFNTEPSQSISDKAQCVLFEVMQKSEIYSKFRKLRAPTATKQAVPQALPAKVASATKVTAAKPMSGAVPIRPVINPGPGLSGNGLSTTNVISLNQNSNSQPLISESANSMAKAIPFDIPAQYQALNNDQQCLHQPYHPKQQQQMQQKIPQRSPQQFTQQIPQHNPHQIPHHILQQLLDQVPQLQQQQPQLQSQSQSQQYHKSTTGQDPISFGMAHPTTSSPLVALEQTSSPNEHVQPPSYVSPHTAESNMVFFGVANGEALWGYPQVFKAESPETASGEWPAGSFLHQQPRQQAHQQLTTNLANSQFPFTTGAVNEQIQEEGRISLNNISWVSYSNEITNAG